MPDVGLKFLRHVEGPEDLCAVVLGDHLDSWVLGVLDADFVVELDGLVHGRAVGSSPGDSHLLDEVVGIRVNAEVEYRVDKSRDTAQALTLQPVAVRVFLKDYWRNG